MMLHFWNKLCILKYWAQVETTECSGASMEEGTDIILWSSPTSPDHQPQDPPVHQRQRVADMLPPQTKSQDKRRSVSVNLIPVFCSESNRHATWVCLLFLWGRRSTSAAHFWQTYLSAGLRKRSLWLIATNFQTGWLFMKNAKCSLEDVNHTQSYECEQLHPSGEDGGDGWSRDTF